MQLAELLETAPLLIAGVSAVASFLGSWTAMKIHLQYLRRDMAHLAYRVEAAHWRLDKSGAPAAPPQFINP